MSDIVPSDRARMNGQRSRPMTARGLRREKEILDAAADVFARKGYSAASVEDVASLVGMLKGSLYYYVGSKEDLLYRLTKTIHQDALGVLEETKASDGTAEDRLTLLVHLHFRNLTANIAYTRVFYHEFRHLTGERYHEIVSFRETYERYVQGLIEEGQAIGTFCRGRDARVMMIAVLTLLNSVQQWYRPRPGSDAEHLSDEYAAFVVRGLRCLDSPTCTCQPGPQRKSRIRHLPPGSRPTKQPTKRPSKRTGDER